MPADDKAAAEPVASKTPPRAAATDHPAKLNPAADAVCWCCGGQTLKRHCKIVCANCGFLRDCSDP
ncbi:MAG: hypothetical protein IT317_17935 [Anaerolineales bacterium]|nr:hypothetical protein [Anaerolineales bacterium]